VDALLEMLVKPGEDAGVITDAGPVFLGDVTRVMQRVLDVPVVSDRVGGTARRCGGVCQIECELGGAAPQDIAGGTNYALDQGLPIGSGYRAGSV